MSATTVSQFAVELKMPVTALLEQLGKAGVGKQGNNDALTDQDKAKLLDYLRRAHGDESKAKITLTRKQTSEIKATDAHGRARTVQVEVRKKRVLVKREHGAEQVMELPADSIVDEIEHEEPMVEIAVELPPVVVVEPVIEEPVVLVEEAPVVEVPAVVVVEPVVEVPVVAPVVEVAPPPVAKPILTTAPATGERQFRDEHDRRHHQLLERQAREMREKQEREAAAIRQRREAEAAVVAAALAAE